MNQKSKTFHYFKHWSTLMFNQIGKKVKRLRTYNRLELWYKEFDNFDRDKDILKHYIVCRTPYKIIIWMKT